MAKLKYLLLLCFIPIVFAARAQRTEGLTHRTDTSFTNYSAYVSAKKKYPDVVLVKQTLPASVKADTGITYLTVNGQPLQLDAFYPKKPQYKPLPAIIIIHGGGWRSGNRTQHHPLAGQLAASGYVCFTPSYRLSTHALYPAAVQDLKFAVRWVRTHAHDYNVDTNKVAVLGFSAGGQLAALLGTTGKDTLFSNGNKGLIRYGAPVQAIVDIDGILAFVHPESGEGDDSKNISAATNWFGYSKDTHPGYWNTASALSYAGPDTPPTLFINSSVSRMHAGRTDYINKLSRGKVYTEVHTFANSPHTFCLFEPWFTPTVNYITAFLAKVFN